ncbi:hypothetical protein COY48_04230 [Candidatus Collierbacteria bacterium CG_4_10_14_0_8_um_filter_43_86]|uniref:Aminoglycoside phosphotransferase domain-containing protein n=2 Tax=Candidatus Collieribacteriota TaxID=1752725 RepID=A0A2M8BYI5_9BACT|nr:MAG: hypothetical protein COY48_04230 [Candidatus Collierbacteria bacterium CG_4_10_14_0_8_um_filter_43_86]PJB48917.1 MAG: hypothetical protein CO104_00255 [Candidatus Collierbacteria bacterium CG_4_9_14_3_um_filter_43_16]
MSGKEMHGKLNLEEVGRYFENKGYKVQKLEQLWRHVTGQVKFENEKLFLKLASTKEIGERTRNEKSFNESANSIWKKYIKTFQSPKVFDEGYFQDKYWFIGEFVFGKPLAEVKGKISDISEKDIIKTAEIAKNILEISDLSLLPKDREHLKEMWKVRIHEISSGWSNNCKIDTKALLQYIKDKSGYMETASSHGDLTPWHIMKTNNNVYYLIDSEAAQMGGLKFYDVAYFYHRVYTKLKRPYLAEQFLKIFKEAYKWTEKNDKEFAPVLASRIMGGYFDAERDGVTSVELNREMEERLYGGVM